MNAIISYSYGAQAAFRPFQTHAHNARYGHAVVIGGSIAGLLAAKVLSDFFKKVTIIDRDVQPDPVQFRSGIPQARHAHRLLPRGLEIMEEQFPGLIQELLAKGAINVDTKKEITFQYGGEWHTAVSRPKNLSLSCSRPLLESTIYRRVAALPGVEIKQGLKATRLHVDSKNEKVTGIWLQCRCCGTPEYKLSTDLIIDASGKNSKAPQWLGNLGFTPPEEWSINSFVGYATRVYEIPEEFDHSWATMYVRPTPPDGTRGGIIIPIEGNRWHVTLLGVGEDYPPLDEGGFLEFAKSMPTQRLYNAIKDAKTLTKPIGFRGAASRVRRYDNLPRFLEGFLVYGDAAYVLNPMYAQGMTASAIGSVALRECLEQQSVNDLAGLSQTFQSHLSQSLSRLWRSVSKQDWQWPMTTITDNTDKIYLN
ncbi:FAD-dependent oxidoreductase [Candidatus Leptofilum sp.]|uniref:FAD-dependent oxidoreductase n=1 Tax=Candidatus Leptofilum sp. TaxID=3241576 RepID=UPI003B5942AF